MTLLIGFILVAVSVYAVSAPFMRPARSRREQPPAVDPVVGPGMPGELEADYRSGILSKEEYDRLRGEHEPEGGRPAPAKTGTTEDEIERRVRDLRQKRTAERKPVAGNLPSGGRRQSGIAASARQEKCPRCGLPFSQGDKFCTGCGTRLSGGKR
jgi:hypothetical protein